MRWTGPALAPNGGQSQRGLKARGHVARSRKTAPDTRRPSSVQAHATPKDGPWHSARRMAARPATPVGGAPALGAAAARNRPARCRVGAPALARACRRAPELAKSDLGCADARGVARTLGHGAGSVSPRHHPGDDLCGASSHPLVSGHRTCHSRRPCRCRSKRITARSASTISRTNWSNVTRCRQPSLLCALRGSPTR